MVKLSESIRYYMRGKSLRDVTGYKNSGVSKTALQQILSGETTKPSPDTLAQLAKWFGTDEVEARYIYRDFMEAAGYLELMPVKTDGTSNKTSLLIEDSRTKSPEDSENIDLSLFPEEDHEILSLASPVAREYLAARLRFGYSEYRAAFGAVIAEIEAKRRQISSRGEHN